MISLPLVPLLFQSDSDLQGRWAIHLQSPFRLPAPGMILELRRAGSEWQSTLVWSTRPPDAFRVKDLSVRGDEVRFVLESEWAQVFRGRLTGDRLEGVVEHADLKWSGARTTETKLERPPEPEDHRALGAALRRPPGEEQIKALREFIAAHPANPLAEYARYQVVETMLMDSDVDQQKAEQRRFLADYPNSRLRDRVEFWLAIGTRGRDERRAALERFIATYPDSFFLDQAVYDRTRFLRDPDERRRALERYLAEFPHGVRLERTYFDLLDLALARKPVDRAAVLPIVRGASAAVPDLPANARRLWNVRYRIADRLASSEALLDDALELARQALALAPKGAAEAQVYTTLGKIHYGRKEYDLARASLERALPNDPGGEARFYLAKIREREGDLDGAIDGYLDAFARQGGAERRRALEDAYRKRHGDLQSLHPRIDEVFRARAPALDAGRYERAARSGARVVLAELFTGTGCGPCAPSDGAFDGLLRRYDRATVVGLQYHLHIPGADPLTTAESEARAREYGVRATPTLVVDGLEPDTGGGQTASSVFNRYVARVEPRLSAPPVVSIDLQVERSPDGIAARGALRPAQAVASSGPATLHLVLAEEEVHYTGTNQVHFHRYVARAGRSRPADLRAGELRFDETFPIAGVAEEQERYLGRYLQAHPDARWSDEIARLDAARLVVIAFVQNPGSREVLQAAFAR
ncbi:MAG: hypothetical protein DMG07_10410 [Acidobacteria bacterium]|nr:MAG: hypothetical protein DMG07_10410 [Acidobacteriota bacterium]